MILSYPDYYNAMLAVEAALNADTEASHNAPVESSIKVCASMGVYIEYVLKGLRHASLTLASPTENLHIRTAVSVLKTILRGQQRGPFCFGLLSPGEWEEATREDANLQQQFDCELEQYQALNHFAFVGASVSIVPINSTEPEDVADWCCQQACHLAKYCVTHGIDLVAIIK